MQKYHAFYQEMIDQNKKLFFAFMDIHDRYAQDQTKYQNEFNMVGKEVVEIIRLWEKKLCSKSEGGGYGKFSANLADKFWSLIRSEFKYIDFVGCK